MARWKPVDSAIYERAERFHEIICKGESISPVGVMQPDARMQTCGDDGAGGGGTQHGIAVIQ
ncbi:hypothetical protein GGQ68_000822 [Sagittula marina]|uniref:Uncharacterized protein n=1 Tax=Sagittula marina TaxID=943940 RepID=A0A7W6DN12_9RHOB|nr:hypothetical protein [Sagittula marina]